MTVNLSELLRCIATALDAVEGDLLGATTNHGKRIATLCIAMGEHLGMQRDELFALSTCALFHDSALTEYILSERPGKGKAYNMKLHCELGQRNVDALPLGKHVGGYVLYHHERADGKGPFGKKEDQFPVGAALIAISDMLDVQLHLQKLQPGKLPQLKEEIAAQAGTRFTSLAAASMLAVLDQDMLASLRDENIKDTIRKTSPKRIVDIHNESIQALAKITANIIDYKSKYTCTHSLSIANIAWWMAKQYQLNPELCTQVYLAGALHDLGKLFIPTEILEKPGKLTGEEFEVIKSHVWWTHEMLREVSGLESICRWASNHHEKLDGTGYPNGYKEEELDFLSRLMACTDIYVAVRESRPYHPERGHEEAMEILYTMAKQGKIDASIVQDLDREMNLCTFSDFQGLRETF